jgi:hypothetical protein
MPAHVASLMDRCLLKDPDQRPTTGNQIAAVLTPVPDVDPGPPLAVRAFLTQRRHAAGLATLYFVRRLLRAGHGREDLVHALTVEHTRRVEELAFRFDASGSGSRSARVRRALCYGCLLGAVALTAGLAAGVLPASFRVALALLATSCGALVLALMARRQTEDPADRPGARHLRWWSGAAGELIFRIAGWGLSPDPPVTPVVEHSA